MASTAQISIRAERELARAVPKGTVPWDVPRYLFAQVFTWILAGLAVIMVLLFVGAFVAWVTVIDLWSVSGRATQVQAGNVMRFSLFAAAMLLATGAGLSMLRDMAINSWHARNRPTPNP